MAREHETDMVVGVCRIVLALPGNDSLKGKRSVVKSILERARVRFQVASAEVADHDVHRRATLGFAVVSNDARHARSVLDKLISFAAGASEAELLEHQTSVEHVAKSLRAGTHDFPLAQLGGEDDTLDMWEDDGGDEEEG
jgi:uncharacterized protein YlxP (DUF503 family)